MADIPLAKIPLALAHLSGADVATDGQVPTSDGAGGVAWETPAAGGSGAGGWELITTATPSGSPATLDFTAIPQTYTDLRIAGKVRGVRSGIATTNLNLRVGGAALDTGLNYDWFQHRDGTNATATDDQATSFGNPVSNLPASTATTGYFAWLDLIFHGYSSTDNPRTIVGDVYCPVSATVQNFCKSLTWWRNGADGIATIQLYESTGGGIDAISEVSLYGR